MKHFLYPVLLLLVACEVGYQVKPDSVAWVHWNEGTGRTESLLDVSNSEEFEVLGDSFGKDSTHVFYKSQIIDGASPKSFQVLSSTYSKDSAAVFFMTSIVEGASSITTKPIHTNYALDDERVFYRQFHIVGASPKTFSIPEFENSEAYACYSVAHWYGCKEDYSQ